MKQIKLISSLILLALGCNSQATEVVDASKFGSYMVGAEQVRVQSGDDSFRGVMNQALITYMETSQDNGAGPVMMLPDVGLSSWIYARTPDSRPGWLQIFASLGQDAYAYDWINNGNSPQNVLPFELLSEGVLCYPQGGCNSESDSSDLVQTINKLQPRDIWIDYGFGPAWGQSYANSQYPTTYAMQLFSSLPAYATRVNAEADLIINARNLIEALTNTGSATLILHGAASEVGLEVARLRPDLVRAAVLIEPGSCDGVAQVSGTPVLALFADRLEERGLVGSLSNCTSQLTAYRRSGEAADILTLGSVPDIGNNNRQLAPLHIALDGSGNSHLMMQDQNGEDIAGMISRWISARAR